MMVLGILGGQYEVRLVKPPLDVKECDRVYFDEYEKLGTPHPLPYQSESFRYLVPEDSQYAIEVILRKGFNYGEFKGVWIDLFDKATDSRLGIAKIPKVDGKDKIQKHQKILIKFLSHVVIGGKIRNEAQMSFRGLGTDESLSKETDIPGVEPTEVGSFQITVCKYGDLVKEEHTEKDFKEQIRQYQASMNDKASKIDGKSFFGDGITHKLSVEGGVEKVPLPVPTPQGWSWTHKSGSIVRFNFSYRGKAFFQKNLIMKCPIPLECQPWRYLTKSERQTCFKTLQTYDKDQILMQKVSEAGPEADTRAIQTELFDTGERPLKWLPWGNLLQREREPLFKKLQLRRAYFENGEIPPEDRPQDLKNKSPNTKPTSLPPTTNKPMDMSAQTAITQVPQSAVKEEPVDKPAFSKAKPEQPEIIILDDSPPRIGKRSAANISELAAPTIKAEMVDPEKLSSVSMTDARTAIEGGPPKRVKLEHGVGYTGGDEDKGLLRLKEEDERQEQELQVIQRMAEMLRQRNERKVRIAALEARARGDPRHGSPS